MGVTHVSHYPIYTHIYAYIYMLPILVGTWDNSVIVGHLGVSVPVVKGVNFQWQEILPQADRLDTENYGH